MRRGAKKQRPIGRVRRTYDLTAPPISRSIAPQKNMFFSRFSGYSSLVFAVAFGAAGCTEAKLPVGGLAIGAPEVPWKDKTHEERQAYMASAFKMPNSLYALPEKDPIAEAQSVDEDTAKFMVEKVVPMFSNLLHQTTGKGTKVDCFTCHRKE
jgi:hypothetical protein